MKFLELVLLQVLLNIIFLVNTHRIKLIINNIRLNNKITVHTFNDEFKNKLTNSIKTLNLMNNKNLMNSFNAVNSKSKLIKDNITNNILASNINKLNSNRLALRTFCDVIYLIIII